MRKRRLTSRRKQKRAKTLIIISTICLTFVMTVTYASFQQNLNISGTSTITKKPGAASTIKDMVSTKPNELYIDNNGDVRYYGENPNNYVTFNNELWRIIGVLNNKVKIVKKQRLPVILTANGETIASEVCYFDYSCIDMIQWDMNGTNNWNNSTLKRYLNGAYYNSIDTNSRNMIAQETWYLGGPTTSNYNDLTASEYYVIERSNNVYPGNPTFIIQNIGLLYVSDYLYSGGQEYLNMKAGNMEDHLLSYLTQYTTAVYTWILTPLADVSNNALATYTEGVSPSLSKFTTKATSDELWRAVKNGAIPYVVPALYLKENVEIISGSGSQNDPFILK